MRKLTPAKTNSVVILVSFQSEQKIHMDLHKATGAGGGENTYKFDDIKTASFESNTYSHWLEPLGRLHPKL